MRTIVILLLLCSNANGQISKNKFPDGFDEQNIETIQLKRIEAAELAVKLLSDQMQSGLQQIEIISNSLSIAHMELLEAKLDMPLSKEERLDSITTALNAHLNAWRVTESRSRQGAGPSSIEAQARAKVFKLRAMYLKESQAKSK